MDDTDLTKIMDGLKKIDEVFGGTTLTYQWRYILECANTIWDRCPFSKGDRVALTKTPDINPDTSWGWMGAKHFLVEGAVATVVDRQFYKGMFRFGLKFDNDSWIHHRDGSINPREENDRGLYYFGEKDIERLVE